MGHESPGSAERPDAPGEVDALTDADLAGALARFRLRWGDEAACLAYVERVCWPDGFLCQACGWTGEPWRFRNRTRVLGCRGCQRHASLTAGTPLHGAHLPVATWFAAAALLRLEPSLTVRRLRRLLRLPSHGTTFVLGAKLRESFANGGFPWPDAQTEPPTASRLG